MFTVLVIVIDASSYVFVTVLCSIAGRSSNAGTGLNTVEGLEGSARETTCSGLMTVSVAPVVPTSLTSQTAYSGMPRMRVAAASPVRVNGERLAPVLLSSPDMWRCW